MRDRDARLHEQSGETAIAFCRAEGGVLSAFGLRRARWRKQQGRARTSSGWPAARFIHVGEVQVVAPMRSPRRMRPDTEPAATVTVRIERGGGVMLNVTRS